MSYIKIAVVAFIAAAIIAFFASGGAEYLTLDALKSQHDALRVMLDQHPVQIAIIYSVAYIIITALSLPGAAIMTLAAGAFFGVWWGTLIVSFASTIGATCAFLIARWLVGDAIRRKYADSLRKVDEGFAKEGAFYVFAIRLTPALPFFLVNWLLACTPVKTRIYYIMSQIGMLPGTIVYVYAGTQLAELESLSDILSPTLLLAFTALALLPLAAKKLIAYVRKTKGTAHGTV